MQQSAKTANKYGTRVSARITREKFVCGFLSRLFCLHPCFFSQYLLLLGRALECRVSIKSWIIQVTRLFSGLKTTLLQTPCLLRMRFMGGGRWFAQRPTISAVDPEYLTDNRELAPAKNASLLLDTDFMIDNGYIQVREDGDTWQGTTRKSLPTLNWTYYPYSFFNFDSSKTEIYYTLNGIQTILTWRILLVQACSWKWDPTMAAQQLLFQEATTCLTTLNSQLFIRD